MREENSFCTIGVAVMRVIEAEAWAALSAGNTQAGFRLAQLVSEIRGAQR